MPLVIERGGLAARSEDFWASQQAQAAQREADRPAEAAALWDDRIAAGAQLWNDRPEQADAYWSGLIAQGEKLWSDKPEQAAAYWDGLAASAEAMARARPEQAAQLWESIGTNAEAMEARRPQAAADLWANMIDSAARLQRSRPFAAALLDAERRLGAAQLSVDGAGIAAAEAEVEVAFRLLGEILAVTGADGAFEGGGAAGQPLAVDVAGRPAPRVLTLAADPAAVAEAEAAARRIALGEALGDARFDTRDARLHPDAWTLDAAWQGQPRGMFGGIPIDITARLAGIAQQGTTPGADDYTEAAIARAIQAYYLSLVRGREAMLRPLFDEWRGYRNALERGERQQFRRELRVLRADARNEARKRREGINRAMRAFRLEQAAVRREAQSAAYQKRAEARRERARARSMRQRQRRDGGMKRAPFCAVKGKAGCITGDAGCYHTCGWNNRMVCNPTAAQLSSGEVVACGQCCKGECAKSWGTWFLERASEIINIQGPPGTIFVTAPIAAMFYLPPALLPAFLPVPECPAVVQTIIGVFPWAAFGPCCTNPSGCAGSTA